MISAELRPELCRYQTLNFINENVDKAKILAIDYDDRSANFCLVFKKIGVNNNET